MQHLCTPDEDLLIGIVKLCLEQNRVPTMFLDYMRWKTDHSEGRHNRMVIEQTYSGKDRTWEISILS